MLIDLLFSNNKQIVKPDPTIMIASKHGVGGNTARDSIAKDNVLYVFADNRRIYKVENSIMTLYDTSMLTTLNTWRYYNAKYM